MTSRQAPGVRMSRETGTGACPRLPGPIARIGRLLPIQPLRPVLARTLQQVFSDALQDGTLELLEGRKIVIDVEDLGLQLGFGQHQGRIQVSGGQSADVVIRGSAAAFLWLSAKRADPDALFFHRHLVMEGDTELGLTIKNLLDATELDALPSPVRRSMEWFADRIPGNAPGSIT